jgi:hypothetical protein
MFARGSHCLDRSCASAVQAYRLGRARRRAELRLWGWRLTVLVIASWLNRMHYVIWNGATGGIWTTPDMTGPFDRFEAWAFYLSYLAVLEALFRLGAAAPVHPALKHCWTAPCRWDYPATPGVRLSAPAGTWRGQSDRMRARRSAKAPGFSMWLPRRRCSRVGPVL